MNYYWSSTLYFSSCCVIYFLVLFLSGLPNLLIYWQCLWPWVICCLCRKPREESYMVFPPAEKNWSNKNEDNSTPSPQYPEGSFWWHPLWWVQATISSPWLVLPGLPEVCCRKARLMLQYSSNNVCWILQNSNHISHVMLFKLSVHTKMGFIMIFPYI